MSWMSFAMRGPTASDSMLTQANTAGSTGTTFCFLHHNQTTVDTNLDSSGWCIAFNNHSPFPDHKRGTVSNNRPTQPSIPLESRGWRPLNGRTGLRIAVRRRSGPMGVGLRTIKQYLWIRFLAVLIYITAYSDFISQFLNKIYFLFCITFYIIKCLCQVP